MIQCPPLAVVECGNDLYFPFYLMMNLKALLTSTSLSFGDLVVSCGVAELNEWTLSQFAIIIIIIIVCVVSNLLL